MRIKKKSGEFRGKNRCHILREHEDLELSTLKNVWYDNAIIVKDIMKGYLKGEFKLEEFADLVSQGVEDDYITEESGRLRQERLVKCLRQAGKPSVTKKGRMEDTSVGKCLELYFLHLFGRSLVKDGEVRNVRASYYFMKKYGYQRYCMG